MLLLRHFVRSSVRESRRWQQQQRNQLIARARGFCSPLSFKTQRRLPLNGLLRLPARLDLAASAQLNAAAPSASAASFSSSSSEKSGGDGGFESLAFHYSVSGDGDETKGPVSFAELVELYNEGTVAQDTLVWHVGMGETWSSVKEVKGLRFALEQGATPPLDAGTALDNKKTTSGGLDDYKGWAEATTSGPKFWLNEVREMVSNRGWKNDADDDEEAEKKKKRKAAADAVQLTGEELDSETWYYVAKVGDSQVGPVSLRTLRELYMYGELDRRASIWREGFDAWYQLVDVEEVRLPIMAYDDLHGCKWKEFKDLDGRPYYNSLEGKDSEWEEPEELRAWRVEHGVPTAAEKAALERAQRRRTPEMDQRYRDSIWAPVAPPELTMSRTEFQRSHAWFDEKAVAAKEASRPRDPDEPADLTKPVLDFVRRSAPYQALGAFFLGRQHAALQSGLGYVDEGLRAIATSPPPQLQLYAQEATTDAGHNPHTAHHPNKASEPTTTTATSPTAAAGDGPLVSPDSDVAPVPGPTPAGQYYFNQLSKQAFWVHPHHGPVVERAGRVPRLMAGVVDTVACAVAGVAVYAGVEVELDATAAAQFGGFMTFLVGMVLRDSMFEAGTRSLGKRIMGLEIVRTDAMHAGMLPGRGRTALRNIYLPLTQLGQIIYPWPQLFFLADFAAVFVTPTGQRLGDHLASTAVVAELPERPARVADFVAQLAQRDVDENVGKQHDARKTETFGKLRVLPREDVARLVAEDHLRGPLPPWRRARIDEATEDVERYFSPSAGGMVGYDAHDDRFFCGKWVGAGAHPGSSRFLVEATAAAITTKPRENV